jgi:type 1 glutamine amidotransferase
MRTSFFLFFAILACFSWSSFHNCSAQGNESPKKVLAVIGDAWHSAAPIYNHVVKKFESKGYQTDVVMDNKVPFEHFSDYDVIIISRYAYDNFTQFEKGVFQRPEGRVYTWINKEQEDALEQYVLNGGRVFFHHDGHCYYSQGGGISRLAKTNHKGHPPMIQVTMQPTGKLPELTAGIESFVVADEEFRMDLDEESTNVFLVSYSEQNGRTPQGWTHDYGKGIVLVFVPGHDRYSLENPMIGQCISNIVDYLDK